MTSRSDRFLEAAYRRIERIAPGVTRRDEPLSRYTTLRIGGPADICVKPRTVGAALDVLAFCQRESVRYLALGKGSNILVSDSGYRGAVINLSGCFCRYKCFEGGARCGAGLSLPRLVRRLATDGFSGLEFAAGIPGTVGGAIATNAGAHGAEVSDLVKNAVVMMQGERRVLNRENIPFSYREGQVSGVVLEVGLELDKADPELIHGRIEEFMNRRKGTQPVREKTAGCVFRNPPEDSAGRVIDSLGLKGTIVGGAKVSDLHANFFINADGAAAADVLALVRLVRERVANETGMELELEIELVGDFPQ